MTVAELLATMNYRREQINTFCFLEADGHLAGFFSHAFEIPEERLTRRVDSYYIYTDCSKTFPYNELRITMASDEEGAKELRSQKDKLIRILQDLIIDSGDEYEESLKRKQYGEAMECKVREGAFQYVLDLLLDPASLDMQFNGN